MSKELKILLVDDDKIILFMHANLLKRSGIRCSIIPFENAGEALHFLDAHESTDTAFYILLDINMPGMNGWEFLASIQDRPYLPRTSVVMVSSATERAERERAAETRPVIGYFDKPLTLEACREIVAFKEVSHYFTDPDNAASESGPASSSASLSCIPPP